MAITASQVKELRERTGAGMMDCKKALTATDGDMDKAIDYLREKGLSKAAKKASRVAAEGLVDIYLDEANKVAALVEVNCETDFVANTDDYKNLVHSITKHVALTKPADMQALLDSTFTGSDKKVSEIVTEAIAKIGEKLISAVSLSMNMAAIPWVTISMAQARLASSLNSKAAMKNWPNMLPCTLQLLTLATWIALLCRLMFWTMKRKSLLNRLATKANRKRSSKRWSWAASKNSIRKTAWLIRNSSWILIRPSAVS